MCAFGICIALLERHRTGKGQIIDSSMVEGAAYVGSWLMRSRQLEYLWPGKRGENVLDSGSHFYDTYETKDGKFMAVAALEPQFYQILLDKLNLANISQFENDDKTRKLFTNIFKEKTQNEWCKIFEDCDACVTPVLDWEDAHNNLHNKERNSFADKGVPNPAPKLSNHNLKSTYNKKNKTLMEDTEEILNEIGYNKKDIIKLYEDGIILLESKPKL